MWRWCSVKSALHWNICTLLKSFIAMLNWITFWSVSETLSVQFQQLLRSAIDNQLSWSECDIEIGWFRFGSQFGRSKSPTTGHADRKSMWYTDVFGPGSDRTSRVSEREIIVVRWCSGYHVCFTRRRSRVQASLEPLLFFFFGLEKSAAETSRDVQKKRRSVSFFPHSIAIASKMIFGRWVSSLSPC